MNQGAVPATSYQGVPRFRVFIDYWNFQLSMNHKEEEKTGAPSPRVQVDWAHLGEVLAQKAADTAKIGQFSYDGSIIYASYNPLSPDKRFYRWMTTWLNRQPGVHVECLERHPKSPPRCPTCHKLISSCPHKECGAQMVGTIEKGVDTLIVTDMIRLAWERANEVAVIASSDRDLIPAVRLLDHRGLKVIQAGFPPSGTDLATASAQRSNGNSSTRTFDISIANSRH